MRMQGNLIILRSFLLCLSFLLTHHHFPMTNITLSDYVGFIFSEITRARVIADNASREIALKYAEDEVLKNFSVPRFKIPEMELTIPVVIAGAKFSNAVSFTMAEDDFKKFITGKANNVINTINIKKSGVNRDFTIIRNIRLVNPAVLNIRPPGRRPGNLNPDTTEPIIDDFYKQLVTNQDPNQPDNIVDVKWAEVFSKKLEENNLLADYKQLYPNNELFINTRNEVLAEVMRNTVISKTRIDNLLVTPETNIVKNEGDAISVFTIHAKITEEGLFIKTMRDEQTGKENKVVEFE